MTDFSWKYKSKSKNSLNSYNSEINEVKVILVGIHYNVFMSFMNNAVLLQSLNYNLYNI